MRAGAKLTPFSDALGEGLRFGTEATRSGSASMPADHGVRLSATARRYGLAVSGGRFTGTPNVGFGLRDGGTRDWHIGWRLTSAVRGDSGFEVSLDATRREPANDDGPPEHDVMLRSLIRW